MAADAVVNIQGNTKPLEGSLKQMRQEIKSLSGQLGSGILSNEDQQAVTSRIAFLKGKVQDLSASVSKFDPSDTFGNFATILGVGNTALVAVTNSLELFGVKEEEIKGIQEKLNKLIQVGVVLQQLADTNRLKGMLQYYSNKVKELLVDNLSIKAKQTEVGTTVGLTVVQRAWNAAVAANPIMLLVSAILLLVTAGAVLYANMTDNIEASKDYEKALDGVIIKDDKLREAHNASIIELKKLQNEFKVLIGTMTESEAAIDDLENTFLADIDSMAKAHSKATEEIIKNNTKWYDKLGFGLSEGSWVKQMAEREKLDADYNVSRKDREDKYQQQLLNSIESSNKKMQQLNFKTQESIQQKRLETFNKTIDNAKKEYEKVKEYSAKIVELNKQQSELDVSISDDLLSGQAKKLADIEKERVARNKTSANLKDEVSKYQQLLDLSQKKLENDIKLAKIQYQNIKSGNNPYTAQIEFLKQQIEAAKSNLIKNPSKDNSLSEYLTQLNQQIIDFKPGKKIDYSKALVALPGFRQMTEEQHQARIKIDADFAAIISKITDYNVSMQDSIAKEIDWKNKTDAAGEALASLKELLPDTTKKWKFLNEAWMGSNTTSTNAADAVAKFKRELVDASQSVDELALNLLIATDNFGRLDEKSKKADIEKGFNDAKDAINKYYDAQKNLLKLEYQKTPLNPEYLLKLKTFTYEQAKAIQDLIDKYKELGNTTKSLKEQFKESQDEVIQLAGNIGLTASALFTQQVQHNFEVANKAISDNYDKQVENIDRLKEYGIISEQEANDRKLKAKEAYDARVRKQKIKEAQIEKRTALFEIAVNAAVAITKALSKGNYAEAILAGIQGSLQASIVASKPLPVLAKGGLLKGPSHANGGITIPGVAEVEGNEFVVNRRSTNNNLALLQSLNNSNVDMIAELSNRLDTLIALNSVPVRSFVVEADITKSQQQMISLKNKAYV